LNRRIDDARNAAVRNAPDFRTFEDFQRQAQSKIRGRTTGPATKEEPELTSVA
jgi:hypothetical protein